MDETKDPKANQTGGTPQRDAEATSSETLGDLEESEQVKGGGSTGSALEGSSPRPASEGGGRADGSDTGGPM
ncbi:MAG TPA: hypothetical protein VN228_03000 [Pyrinomonadaceae bacterium]|nr:hypothetical protein [Pyrinomonadaceae bacterium]